MFNFFSSPKPRRHHTIKRADPKSCKLDGKSYCKAGDNKLQPPIARAGGKRQLADKIISKMKPHKIYDEPFVGGGAVFYKKPLAEKSYINDKDKDIVKVHKSFKEGRGFNQCDMKPSKAKFDRIKGKSNKSACDVAYLNKLSFGSGMTSFADKKFSGRGTKETGITYQKAHQEEYKEKLKNTSVTSSDFKEVMKKSDSKETVHFLDPPYVKGSEIYKEKGVTPQEVCDTAKKMKGQVIITYDNHPDVRKACKGLKMSKISSRFTLGADSNNKKSSELLITKG